MKKTISILITMMLVCVTITSIGGAVELDGEIDVEITQSIGLVAPKIALEENQTFGPLNVEEDDGTLYVNDTLSIKLNVTDDRETRFFPKFMLAGVFIIRDPASIKISPVSTYLKRLIPVRIMPLTKQGTIDVSNEKYLNISLNYEVNNTIVSENMTMHILTMGILPGDTNGIEGIKIVDYMKVNLKDVTYDMP
jgi:hypothetical protein